MSGSPGKPQTYKLVLFDLDGTLTDPAAGITRSVRYALAKFGLHADTDALLPFIGPPLQESFQRFYSFSPAKARQAVGYYREYYAETGLFENSVYPGITELLQRLHSAGKRLAVATSKPTFFAEQVLRHFQLERFFSIIAGSNMDGTRVRKGEVIDYALAQADCSCRRETVMIGDREHDIIGARESGIDSIAVFYGYGSREELRLAGPTYLAASVAELGKLLGVDCPGK